MNTENKAQAEATPEREWCLCDRLLGLALAARLMEAEGWDLKHAALGAADEEGFAGGVLATTSAEDGETLLYSLHLDQDPDFWLHVIGDTPPVWSPADMVISADIVRRLAAEERAYSEVGKHFVRTMYIA